MEKPVEKEDPRLKTLLALIKLKKVYDSKYKYIKQVKLLCSIDRSKRIAKNRAIYPKYLQKMKYIKDRKFNLKIKKIIISQKIYTRRKLIISIVGKIFSEPFELKSIILRRNMLNSGLKSYITNELIPSTEVRNIYIKRLLYYIHKISEQCDDIYSAKRQMRVELDNFREQISVWQIYGKVLYDNTFLQLKNLIRKRLFSINEKFNPAIETKCKEAMSKQAKIFVNASNLLNCKKLEAEELLTAVKDITKEIYWIFGRFISLRKQLKGHLDYYRTATNYLRVTQDITNRLRLLGAHCLKTMYDENEVIRNEVRQGIINILIEQNVCKNYRKVITKAFYYMSILPVDAFNNQVPINHLTIENQAYGIRAIITLLKHRLPRLNYWILICKLLINDIIVNLMDGAIKIADLLELNPVVDTSKYTLATNYLLLLDKKMEVLKQVTKRSREVLLKFLELNTFNNQKLLLMERLCEPDVAPLVDLLFESTVTLIKDIRNEDSKLLGEFRNNKSQLIVIVKNLADFLDTIYTKPLKVNFSLVIKRKDLKTFTPRKEEKPKLSFVEVSSKTGGSIITAVETEKKIPLSDDRKGFSIIEKDNKQISILKVEEGEKITSKIIDAKILPNDLEEYEEIDKDSEKTLNNTDEVPPLRNNQIAAVISKFVIQEISSEGGTQLILGSPATILAKLGVGTQILNRDYKDDVSSIIGFIMDFLITAISDMYYRKLSLFAIPNFRDYKFELKRILLYIVDLMKYIIIILCPNIAQDTAKVEMLKKDYEMEADLVAEFMSSLIANMFDNKGVEIINETAAKIEEEGTKEIKTFYHYLKNFKLSCVQDSVINKIDRKEIELLILGNFVARYICYLRKHFKPKKKRQLKMDEPKNAQPIFGQQGPPPPLPPPPQPPLPPPPQPPPQQQQQQQQQQPELTVAPAQQKQDKKHPQQKKKTNFYYKWTDRIFKLLTDFGKTLEIDEAAEEPPTLAQETLKKVYDELVDVTINDLNIYRKDLKINALKKFLYVDRVRRFSRKCFDRISYELGNYIENLELEVKDDIPDTDYPSIKVYKQCYDTITNLLIDYSEQLEEELKLLATQLESVYNKCIDHIALVLSNYIEQQKVTGQKDGDPSRRDQRLKIGVTSYMIDYMLDLINFCNSKKKQCMRWSV